MRPWRICSHVALGLLLISLSQLCRAVDVLSATKLESCINDGSQPGNGSSIYCREKLVVTVTVDSGDSIPSQEIAFSLKCIGSPTGDCPCPCNYATDASCKCRDLPSALTVTLQKGPLWASYPLYYLQAFNYKPYEAVVRPGAGKCKADDLEPNPTCNWYYFAGQKVPDSQGFVCECDSGQIWDTTFGGSTQRTRANLDCDFFSDPLDILLGRKPCSAHCLMMDPHWYGGYGLGEAMLQFEITATVTLGNSSSNSSAVGSIPGSQEVLVLSPSFPWALSSGRTLSAKLLGDLAGYSQLPVLSERLLMIPHPKTGQTIQDMLNNRTEWMLMDRSKISFDGSECDKVGTSFSAFRYQTGACLRAPQVCLSNQLKDVLESDRARITAGRVPLYLVSQYTYGLDSQLKAFRGGVLSFALPVVGLRSSLVLLEASADSIKFVTNTSPGKIAAARMCQFAETRCGGFEASASRGYLHALIVNTGTLDSSYTLSVTNCSAAIRAVEAQRFALAAGKNGTISPFQIYVENDKASTSHSCWLVLLDSLGKITDRLQVPFYTNATSYDDWPSGGLLGNGTGTGSVRNRTCTACARSWDVFCAARNSCWGRVKGFVGGLIGVVVGLGLLLLAAKMGWLSTLFQLCAGLCACSGGKSSSKSGGRKKGSRSSSRYEQDQRRGSAAAGGRHSSSRRASSRAACRQDYSDDDNGADSFYEDQPSGAGTREWMQGRDRASSGRQYGRSSRASPVPFDSYDGGSRQQRRSSSSSPGKGAYGKSSGHKSSISGFAMANPLWQQEDESDGPAAGGGRRLSYSAGGVGGSKAAKTGRTWQEDAGDEVLSDEGDPGRPASRGFRPTSSSSSRPQRLPSPFEGGGSRQHHGGRSPQPAQLDPSSSGSSLSPDEGEPGSGHSFEQEFNRGRAGSAAAAAAGGGVDGGFRRHEDYDSASGQHYSSSGSKQPAGQWQQRRQQQSSSMGADWHSGSISSPERGHHRTSNAYSSSSGVLPRVADDAGVAPPRTRPGLQRSLSSSPLPSDNMVTRSSSFGSRMAAYATAAGSRPAAAAAEAGVDLNSRRGRNNSQQPRELEAAASRRWPRRRSGNSGSSGGSSSSEGSPEESQMQQWQLARQEVAPHRGLTCRLSAGGSRSGAPLGSGRASQQHQLQPAGQQQRLRPAGSGFSSETGAGVGYTRPAPAATAVHPRASLAAAAAAAAAVAQRGRPQPPDGFFIQDRAEAPVPSRQPQHHRQSQHQPSAAAALAAAAAAARGRMVALSAGVAPGRPGSSGSNGSGNTSRAAGHPVISMPRELLVARGGSRSGSRPPASDDD